MGSGGSSHWAVGGTSRVHAGQAIGVLAGALGTAGPAGPAPETGPSAEPGAQPDAQPDAATGLSLIAAHGEVALQAQSDRLQVAARDTVSIRSLAGKIDWAAAKTITLSTAAGANIRIEGGNITVECPGTLTIRAAVKGFVGPEKVGYALPTLPHEVCVQCLLSAAAVGSPFAKRG